MKKLIFVFGVLLTFTACTDQNSDTASNEAPTIEGLKASIKEMDDSLKVLMDEAVKSPEYKMNRVAYHEAINRNKDFYHNFPEDPYAETALDKIAALYLQDRKSTRLNSSHVRISYAVFCLKKKKKKKKK